MKTGRLLNGIAILQCIISMAAAAAVLSIWLAAFTNDDAPVQIASMRDHPAIHAEPFLQNDPAWAEDRLGDSPFTMARSGCLVCCIASALEAQGMDTDPGRLNALLGGQGAYTGDGEIIWSRLEDALPGVRAETPSDVRPEAIEAMLEKGVCPIVKVKYLGYGYAHWVLITGSRDGEYLCMDPLDPREALRPLYEHGSVVYRWRAVYIR